MPDQVDRMIRPGLIVSCQAGTDSPLHGPQIMAAMARAAVEGGAVGVRANGPDDVQAIKAAVGVPVVGIFKHTVPGYDVYITPDLERAAQVARRTESVWYNCPFHDELVFIPRAFTENDTPSIARSEW